MEIDNDLPQYGSDRQPAQSYNSPKPVMSQQQVQQSYSNTSAQANNHDAFFKEKAKSYRPHIIITALMQVGLIFVWPFIAIILLVLMFEDEVMQMTAYYTPPAILEFLNILDIATLAISILIIFALIYFTIQDSKKNTGQNPTSASLLVFFLGFIGAFIYILTTLNKQGKAVQQAPPNPQNPIKPWRFLYKPLLRKNIIIRAHYILISGDSKCKYRPQKLWQFSLEKKWYSTHIR